MVRTRIPFVLPLIIGLLVAYTLAPWRRSSGGPGQEVLLDSVDFEYRDHHEGGRTVAVVGVELLRTDGGRGRLRATPRAVGPEISPVPGFRGVSGSNLQAARELGRLLEADELELVVRPRQAGEAVSGKILEVRREALPERSLGPDGRIDFDARTSVPHVVSVGMASATFGPGEHVAEIRAAGTPRLSIELRFDGETGRIGAIRGQAEPGETEAPQ